MLGNRLANLGRSALVVGLVCAYSLALFSCIGRPSTRSVSVAITFEDSPRRPGVPVIFVALPAAEAAKQALDGLRYETEEDFDIVTFVVSGSTTVHELAQGIEAAKPSALVLMNNPTLTLYYKYQQQEEGRTPPAIAILSSFLPDVIGKLENTGGVAYEVPAVTIFPSLRDYSDVEISRVGVIHRGALTPFVERQRKLAKVARLELVSEVIGDRPGEDEVEKAIRKLRKRNVDAFWVLNDNILLSSKTYRGWMNGFHKGKKLPVVVGVRPLIDSEHHFGTFAILPNHEGLGSQAGEILHELAESDWQDELSEVQEPIAVEVVVDVHEARTYFRLREDMFNAIDVAVE